MNREKIAVILLRTSLVVAVLYSVNLIGVAYYRQKVNFILYETAEHVAAICSWNCNINPYAVPAYLNREARLTANKLLSRAGLPEARRIDVSRKDNIATVTIVIEGFPQMTANVLPAYLSMNESLTVDLLDYQPPALLTFFAGPNKVLLPCYGKYVQQYSQNPDESAVAEAPPGTALLRPFKHRYAVFTVGLPGDVYGETLKTYHD